MTLVFGARNRMVGPAPSDRKTSHRFELFQGNRVRRPFGVRCFFRVLLLVSSFLFTAGIAPYGLNQAQAANTDLRWRTINTEHFVIHYPAGTEPAADRIARQCERAYDIVTEALAHNVRQRIHVIVNDASDTANGFARAVPYPRVVIRLVAPHSMNVLGAYDDWLNIVILHELVHVVHGDTVHGFPRLLNAVLGLGGLGKVTAPNNVQPGWIVEGLAVVMESKYTSQGRRRSVLFDGLLRTAVLEGKLQQLDRVTNNSRIYPFGTMIYLYGLHFMQYIAAQYGHDKLAELSHIYGSRWLPFGINRAIKDVLGVDFDQLWEEFERSARDRFFDQARLIRSRGLREGRRLTFDGSAGTSGSHLRNPVWSSDGQSIYFFDNNGHRQTGVFEVPADGSRIRSGVQLGRQGATPDRKKLINVESSTRSDPVLGDPNDMIFDRLAAHDWRYSWSDLYRWTGPGRRRWKQLTFGLRASEPDVSPDGREVVFVRNDVAQSRIGILQLDNLQVTEIAPLHPFQQVYNPEWSPDGSKIALSMWREGGYRDIAIYDRKAERYEWITNGRTMDSDPTWSPDGRYLLFVSDRSGVSNLHAYEFETKQVVQVSNVLGGAFEPAWSPDGQEIAYVGLTSEGFSLWKMDFKPDRFLPAMPEIDALPVAPVGDPGLEGYEMGREPSMDSKPYRAWRTLYPRNLIPRAFDFKRAGFLTSLSLDLRVSDVRSRHSVAGNFNYLKELNEPSGSVAYTMNRLFPTVSMAFSRTLEARNGYRRYVYDNPNPDPVTGEDPGYLREGYRERSTGGSFELEFPILGRGEGMRHRASGRVTYGIRNLENLDASDEPIDPNAPASNPPEVGRLGSLSMSFSYSNQDSVLFGYGTKIGRSFGVSVSLLDKVLGSQHDDLQVRGSYEEKIPMPWRGHQYLALRLAGGASAGGLRRRGAFSLGGFSRPEDVVRRLINRQSSLDGAALRGYQSSAFTGRYFTLLNAEYRIPIVDIERGIGMLPLFMRRIVVAGFTDWGMAWTQSIRLKDFVGSVGGTLIFNMSVYNAGLGLFFQYGHGFHTEDGVDYLRVMVGRSF